MSSAAPRALLAALLLFLAAPPAPWAPWGGLLFELPGLAVLYLVLARARRPYRWAYAIGVVHVLGFSASLRFVSLPGYVGIGLVGGLYFVATAAWTRGFARRGMAPLGFGLGVAATAWIRSHVPEIPYPHAQPIHALYQLPWLLGPVGWGGEVFGNLLLAWTAARAAEAVLGGVPRGGRAWSVAALPVVLWAVAALWTPPRAAPPPAGAPRLRVALVEPGLPDAAELQRRVGRSVDVGELPPGVRTQAALHHAELPATLAEATAALAGSDAAPPDLVVWPESALPGALHARPGSAPGAVPDAGLRRWLERSARAAFAELPAHVRVLAGTTLRDGAGGRRGCVALLDRDATLLGWHEKQRPVPAGERVPFLDLLPRPWLRRLVAWTGTVLSSLPDMEQGAVRSPLPVGPPAARVPVAGLLCFDNAFDDVARRAVAAGARVLVVASNEAWYRHGAELPQMLAMSVCRALETDTPVVRSTIDGSTAWIDGRGRVVARLPLRPGARGRVLWADVVPGPGTLGGRHVAQRALALAVPLSGVWALVLLGAGARHRRNLRNPNAARP